MSVLRGVATQDQTQRREQLERFALQYTQPLVTFLSKTKRIEHDVAEEIVQDFWLAKLILPPPEQTIAAKYLEKANERQASPPGSFRRYLMRSIGYHFLDRVRRNKNAPASLDAIDGFDAVSEQDCRTFDAAWANTILRTCINEVHQECLANNQLSMWDLFCAQIVVPKLRGTPPPGYADLALQFQFSDAKSAANAVRTVIRKFQSHLKARVTDYLPVASVASVASQDEFTQNVEQECADILGLLSMPGALDNNMFEDVIGTANSVPNQFAESFLMGSSIASSPFLVDPSRSLYSNDEDFRIRWNQLLATPISQWLLSHGEPCSQELKATFASLTHGESLSKELLLAIRNTAKRLAREEQDEPAMILATLYLASIANGHCNHATMLTADPPDKIVRRADQILKHPWLDSSTRNLLVRFQASLLE